MSLTKKIARNILFPAIVNLGLEKRWRNRSRNNILNILYHGVVNHNDLSFSPRHISRDQFIRNLRYIKRNFDIVSLPEAFELYRNHQPLKRKTLTISFDDGYLNNLETALPIIEEFNVPVTFFISGISTQEMEVRALWTDLIACLQYFNPNKKIIVDELEFINLVHSPDNMHLLEYLKTKEPPDRDRIMNELTKRYDLIPSIKKIPDELWKLQTASDLKKLAASSFVTIGSHGHLHYNLGQISSAEAKNELTLSKKLLEEKLQQEINMIAYPDGSYTEEVKGLAERSGYDKQLAVKYKCVDDPEDPRILPRYGVAVTTTVESNIFFINKAFNTLGFN